MDNRRKHSSEITGISHWHWLARISQSDKYHLNYAHGHSHTRQHELPLQPVKKRTYDLADSEAPDSVPRLERSHVAKGMHLQHHLGSFLIRDKEC